MRLPLGPAAVPILLAMLLAGCSADPPTPSDGADQAVFDDLEDSAQATATTGAIAGVVVDEAIRPLVGANVTLLSANLTVATDGQGRFSFEGLGPGVHFLSIAAAGFIETQVSAEVKAGEVATVRAQLPASTIVQPYKQTVNLRGYVNNYLGYPNFVLEALVPGSIGCACAFDIPVNSNITTLIVEADGTSQVESPLTPTPYYEVFYNGTADGSLEDSAYADFPILLRYGPDFVAKQTLFGVRLTGGVNPVVRMDFDLYVTAFYNAEAPEGWSFIAGST